MRANHCMDCGRPVNGDQDEEGLCPACSLKAEVVRECGETRFEFPDSPTYWGNRGISLCREGDL